MTTTTTHYIAIDEAEIAIMGLGTSPELAIADAADHDCTGCVAVECSPALARVVDERGGAGISWAYRDDRYPVWVDGECINAARLYAIPIDGDHGSLHDYRSGEYMQP